MNSLYKMTLACMLISSLTSIAETVATTDGWTSEVSPAAQNMPAYPKEIADTLRSLNISLEAAPTNSGFPVVTVDKWTQTITIQAADLEEPWIRKVSTGGGLKVPNGKNAQSPYCASTPEVKSKFIPAITSGPNTTMEPMHYSNTFAYGGEPAPMPWAIRIEGGIFFHERGDSSIRVRTKDGVVPVSYNHLLGQNVSGECVRLDSQTSRLLYGLALKYGGISASITGQDPLPVEEGYCTRINGKKKCFAPNYCDEKMVAMAKKGVTEAKDKSQSGLGKFFEGLFGGWSTTVTAENNKPTKPTKPKKRDEVEERFTHPLGDVFGN